MRPCTSRSRKSLTWTRVRSAFSLWTASSPWNGAIPPGDTIAFRLRSSGPISKPSMTSLRQRMTEDMQVRNLALNTQTSYVQQVSLFALTNAREPPSLLAGQFDGTSGDWLAAHITLEQPTLRSHGPKVATKRFQQFGRQHHVTILLALALFDTNDHSLTINVGWLQTDSFGDAKAGGIAGSQNPCRVRTASPPMGRFPSYKTGGNAAVLFRR